MDLSPGHRDKSSKELLEQLGKLSRTYLTIPEVPHSHVSVRNRLTANKKTLSSQLDKTAWMVKKDEVLLKVYRDTMCFHIV